MDSGHSSASQLDLLESALDRPGTIMESSSAVDVSAAPSAATPLWFRRCAYGRRMSSKRHVHHSFCVNCRGFVCDFNNRCDECKALTDKGFETYLRLQKSLQRKSLSTLRPRARAAAAAAVVTPRSLT